MNFGNIFSLSSVATLNKVKWSPFIFLIAGIFYHSTGYSKPSADISFNDQIRPILSDHCIQCHGPDNKSREADLRLDERQGLFGKPGGEAGVIIPGQADESEFIARIFHQDPDEIMPPPETKKPLSFAQKQLLKEWVNSGANFEDHWSFVAPQKSSVPTVDNVKPTFLQNPIDHFIASKLASIGLAPSMEADRRTLIRRIYFDLTGLPPSPEAINRFVMDDGANAYERLVDELLASERFGERMTLAWMDAARYGDSSVFHDDGVRFMWPWRDWVIKSYNNNKPFDSFTIEQLAGDLIPGATVDQQVASGFNRNHGTTDEGGAIDEEYRVEYNVDRVKTTSNVWLGLSMECGQCHDHKYDPISQKEYYQFYAYFNRSRDRGMQSRNGNSPPLVQIFTPSQKDQLASTRSELAKAEKELKESQPGLDVIKSWASNVLDGPPKEIPNMGNWHILGPFKSNNINQGFKKNFGPEKEKEINLSKKYGGHSWNEKPGYKDNTPIDLALPDNTAVYLYKKLESKSEAKWTASLGSDDAIKVFLNGNEVFKKNTSRGVAADQDKAVITLKEGTNHLVLKIVSGGGGSGYFLI